MSGNQTSFDQVTAAVRMALRWDGSRAEHGDYRGRALAAGIAVQGYRSRLVDQVVEYQVAKLGRTAFRTRVGMKVGKGCYALKNARPWADSTSRFWTQCLVHEVVVRQREAGLPIPSVPAIRTEIASEWKVGATAVRTALRSVPDYKPPRISKARAGLSATARGLLKVFEADVPKGSVVCVEWSECLRTMYIPSENASTKRSQKRRLDAAIRELETTRELGMSIRAIEGAVIVGRGRAIPNVYNIAKWGEPLPRFIKLSPGIAFGRAGLWSSVEGVMAKSLVDCVLDEPYVDDNLGHLLGQQSERMLDAREHRADQTRYTARHVFTTVDNGMLAEANRELVRIQEARDENQARVRAIKDLVADKGFVALWDAARTWSGLKDMTFPLSIRRINALGRRFAEIQAAPDTRYAYECILWRDTPKTLRSPEPPRPSKMPEPVEVVKAPIVKVPPTPEELERRRDLRARVEAMKAEEQAERERFAARRAAYVKAGVVMDFISDHFVKTEPLGGLLL